jgi:hypothetical protein
MAGKLLGHAKSFLGKLFGGGAVSAVAKGAPGPSDTAAAAEADPDGMSVDLGGAAAAAGQATLANGTLVAHQTHQGNKTVAWGVADFTAVAASVDGSDPLALSGASLDITGADVIYLYPNGGSFEVGNMVGSRTTVQFVAIDYDNWAPAGGPIVYTVPADDRNPLVKPQDFGLGPSFAAFENDFLEAGNQANVKATSTATNPGGDTLAIADTNAVTLQGQYSAVDGWAFNLVG